MNKIDDALERALGLIEADGLHIEDSLATFSAPEAEQLRPILRTILAVKEGAGQMPDPANEAGNKAKLLAELAELRAMPAEPFSSAARFASVYRARLRSRLARAVAGATAVLVLTGGVAAAAGSSGPASPLYPIKRAVEAVEAALPRSDYAATKLHLGLAETRLAEMETIRNGDDGNLKRLSGEFLNELEEANKLAAGLSTAEGREIVTKSDKLEQRYNDFSSKLEPGKGRQGSRRMDKKKMNQSDVKDQNKDQETGEHDKDGLRPGERRERRDLGDDRDEIKAPESQPDGPDKEAGEEEESLEPGQESAHGEAEKPGSDRKPD